MTLSSLCYLGIRRHSIYPFPFPPKTTKIYPIIHSVVTQYSYTICSSNKTEISSLRLISNGKLTLSSSEEVKKITQLYKRVHIDLGTGDGRFVYRAAKKDDSTLFIGIEPNASALTHVSWKVNRKPSRGGGMGNTLFIHGSIETLPTDFSKIADVITINFPWATLLQAIVTPNPMIMKKIALLGKDNSLLDISLNQSVFNDEKIRCRLNLPVFNQKDLKKIFRSFGISLRSFKLETKSDKKSTWSQHLTLASGRQVLRIIGYIEHGPNTKDKFC